MQSLLSSPPVLWFLSLFNTLVAVAAGIALDGPQRIATSAGMGVVAIGAGASLLRSRTGRTGRAQPALQRTGQAGGSASGGAHRPSRGPSSRPSATAHSVQASTTITVAQANDT